MAPEKGFFNVKYKERSLDPTTAQLIFFAVCIATGYEFGAKHHLSKARERGATGDEITEAVVYSMRRRRRRCVIWLRVLSLSRIFLSAIRRPARTLRLSPVFGLTGQPDKFWLTFVRR